LQGAAVRLKCAALNFHSSLKAHCEIAKIRLCAPLCSCEPCGCGSKCDGKCGGYDEIKYADDVEFIEE
jgi:hypothetical protein